MDHAVKPVDLAKGQEGVKIGRAAVEARVVERIKALESVNSVFGLEATADLRVESLAQPWARMDLATCASSKSSVTITPPSIDDS